MDPSLSLAAFFELLPCVKYMKSPLDGLFPHPIDDNFERLRDHSLLYVDLASSQSTPSTTTRLESSDMAFPQILEHHLVPNRIPEPVVFRNPAAEAPCARMPHDSSPPLVFGPQEILRHAF